MHGQSNVFLIVPAMLKMVNSMRSVLVPTSSFVLTMLAQWPCYFTVAPMWSKSYSYRAPFAPFDVL